MPYYPTVTAPETSREMISVFGGLDRRLQIREGDWADTRNLSTEHYPAMSQRPRREKVGDLPQCDGLTARDALAWVKGGTLYYNGYEIAGLTLQEGEKTMVSMGAYLCIFPDKVYFNTEDHSDTGYMENRCSASGVQYSPCRADGTVITVKYTQSGKPENPAAGEYWMDTGEDGGLKLWSATSAMWTPVAATYIRLQGSGIGTGFSQYDGVSISGCQAPAGATERVKKQIAALNGTVVLQAVETNYLVVAGLLDAAVKQKDGAGVTVSRTVPDMDFITECGNRLWGCKYGVTGGQTVNELYCCALGDFKNWRRYLGLSTDAWAASQGTDGPWTGAATLQGYPLFFKENCIHKVYPSQQGAHQVTVSHYRGVQKGCGASLAVVNEVLYYKSPDGVCAYDGSVPVSIGDALGSARYVRAVGAGYRGKYYLSAQEEGGGWQLLVYDTEKGLWLREDESRVRWFAPRKDGLYFLRGDELLREDGGAEASETAEGSETDGTASLLSQPKVQEGPVEWMAQTGIMGFSYPDKKYISRLNLRMALGQGAAVDLYVQYDSDGCWRHQGHMEGQRLQTFTLPVRPRRCDHLQLKLTGRGEVKLYSLTKILEIGSDV